MLLTVKARRALRALCPDENMEKLGDWLDGPDGVEHITEVILLLSRGYEEYTAYWSAQEGKAYEPQPLTEELIENLSMEQHMDLQREALVALKKGFGMSIETEEPKGEKGKKDKAAKQ